MDKDFSDINFFNTFLKCLNQKKIIFLPIRYKPINHDHLYDGDYDFLTSKKDIKKILYILFDLCVKYQKNFSINHEKYGKTVINILSSDKNNLNKITIEIWNFLEVKDSSTIKYIFFEDIYKQFISNKNNFENKLPLDIEALYYLSHLYTKNKDISSPLVQLRLNYYQKQLSKNKTIYNLYKDLKENPKNLQKISQKANSLLVKEKILFYKSNKKYLKKALLLKIKIDFYRFVSKILKKIKIIPIIGADGVGKTTIINNLQENSKNKLKYYRFKKIFRHTIFYKILYLLKRKKTTFLEKNQFDDLYGDILLWFAIIRFPFLIIYSIFSRKIIVSDRFFHDLLIKNIRFKEKLSRIRKNWKSYIRFIPFTFYTVFLDAPNPTILQRKDELSDKNITRYRKLIFLITYHSKSRFFLYINTKNSIEKSTNDIISNIKLLKKKPNTNTINIQEKDLISSGNERKIYQHPNDPSKVIKIIYKKSKNQNKLEDHYYKYLKKRNVDFSHIAKCYGFVDTSKGKGLIFEKVEGKPLSNAITLGDISHQKAKELLEDLKSYLLKNNILFVDVGLDNIIYNKKLVIVDGLGARRYGWKYKISLYIPFYPKYKLQKQWKKISNSLNKIKTI